MLLPFEPVHVSEMRCRIAAKTVSQSCSCGHAAVVNPSQAVANGMFMLIGCVPCLHLKGHGAIGIKIIGRLSFLLGNILSKEQVHLIF